MTQKVEGVVTVEALDLKTLLEYGFLGAINIILLLKGIPALNELTKSNAALADSLSKLTEQVSGLKISFEYQIRELNTRIEKFEVATTKNLSELRDLIKEARKK